jgi:hypothetical protein
VIVSALVRQEIEKRFPDDAVSVIASFEATPLPFLDAENRRREKDRVHLAIIKLSGGDITRVPHSLEIAARDWRDVLVWSGLGQPNWPDVLRDSGFPVPD